MAQLKCVGIELRRLQSEIEIKQTQRSNLAKKMESLGLTWAGRTLPELVRQQINHGEVAIKAVGDSIANLEATIATLKEMQDRRHAQLSLAQESLHEAEIDLKEVDDRIAEIRGF